MQLLAFNGGTSRRLVLSRLALSALLAAPLLSGCDLDELLEVDDDFTITPGVAQDTSNLANTFAGVKSVFGSAVGGWRNNYLGIISITGLASDELHSTDAFTTRWRLDQRDFDYETSNIEDEPFLDLQMARAEALAAAGLFAQSTQANSAEHAELYNIAGLSTVMLAENYCSGVPLSRVEGDGSFTYGPSLTQTQLFDQAIALFDSAAAVATNSERQRILSLLGKARAQLDKGDFAAAGQTAAQVPNSFADYLVEFDEGATRTENAVYQFNWDEGRISASNQEGTGNRGLPYGTAVDPRTPISATTRTANNGAAPVYLQEKYPDGNEDVALATAYEARYIQAEAALQAGQTVQFETFLNQARALQDLAPLTSVQIGTTAAQRIDTLFRERAYAMWLTGHRYSDLRRLVRQYNRDQATVFPTGTTINNLPYGTDIPFPIPFEEVNNPNFVGCIDTNA